MGFGLLFFVAQLKNARTCDCSVRTCILAGGSTGLRSLSSPLIKFFSLIFQMFKALFFDAKQRLAHLEPTF
ncbi:MAG TPA: hypothetical protein DEA68_07265 [Verrucomicrobiales bacterium]|nr:hypothetical protein [Verrucomicrobiales bacterium]